MKMITAFLFRDITDSQWEEMQNTSCMRQQHFQKNETIFHMGDEIHEIGLVQKGSVNIETIDLTGNKSILGNMDAGQVFGESYALCKEPLMVDAIAAETADILFLNLTILLNTSLHSSWQATIIQNLLLICAHKNLTLSGRIFCTTPKTIRERVMTYLSRQCIKSGSNSFTIPFNRQQLADYLNLDRSALSKELGKMQDEGLLTFHKNAFTLKETLF